MNNAPLNATVFATIKYARLQARRQLITHFGLSNAGRRVEDEFPSDVAGPDTADATETSSDEQSRLRQIVLNQISEFTSVSQYLELVERRLFRGECIASVAKELGINPATARSVVMRARQYLGLTE